MTHTKVSNFVRVAHGLDVEPLLKLLNAKPELWKEITARQNLLGHHIKIRSRYTLEGHTK